MNKIQILSPRGLHNSELKAIAMLEATLPNNWHGFASFLVNDVQGNMEIDLLLITGDRFILCEIKEWNGEIFSNGRDWIQKFSNGHTQSHPSPVHITGMRTKRLAALFKRELASKWGHNYFIDYAIILAGTATVNSLPKNDKLVVFSLDDFCKLAKPNEYIARLPLRKLPQGVKTPNSNTQIGIFKKWFTNDSKAIKEKHKIAGNYKVPSDANKALFAHPKKYYSEFIGENIALERKKSMALLRCWNFDYPGLPVLSQTTQAMYVLREQRVIDFVSEEQPQTKKDYLMQPRHSTNIEEVTSDFIEIYEHSAHLTRLDEYILTLSTENDKIECIKNILVAFSKLHALDIVHRDILLERLWYDSISKAILVSGLIVAKFPDTESAKSVSDMRKELSSSQILLPEEELEDEVKALPIDVYMLGAIIYQVAFNEVLTYDTLGLEWKQPKQDVFNGKLDTFIQQAIHIEPLERYSSASEMLKEFSQIFDREQSLDDNIIAELAPFIKKELVPYVNWQIASNHKNVEGRQSYITKIKNSDYKVKIWTTLTDQNRGNGHYRKLYNFLKRCQIASQSQIEIPPILDYGISSLGLFLVEKYITGLDLCDFSQKLSKEEKDIEKRLIISEKLIKNVLGLHNFEITHGDLKPENILIQEEKGEIQLFLLDLLDIDQFANRKFNTEYASDGELGAIGSDIRAVYLIIDELLSRCGAYVKPIREEIQRAIGNNSNAILPSLETLLFTITSLKTKETENIPYIVLGNSIFNGAACEVTAPHDTFRVRCFTRDSNKFIFYFTGNKQEVKIHAEIGETLHLTRAYVNEITAQDAIKVEQNSKLKIIKCKFIFSPYSHEKPDTLVSILEENFPEILKKDTKKGVHTPTTNISMSILWQKILDEEYELFPTVRVAKELEKNRSNLIVEIYENIDDFEFSKDDKIEVTDGNPEETIYYGLLDVENSKKNIIVIKDVSSKYIKEGSHLQLREYRTAISWRRRNSALKKIINNSSLILDLPEYFFSKQYGLLSAAITMNYNNLYELYEEHLDESKYIAFQNSLKKSVNVIMGPPGTGKTRLLSCIIDYLLRLPEINRILLVSQSHVAVDELAIRSKEMANAIEQKLTGKNIDLSKWVRLGDIELVRPELHDIHVETLQKQYRIDFMRNLENKILALASTLKLPKGFLASAIEAYRDIGEELYKINRNITTTEEDAILIEERKKTLMNKLHNRLLRYTNNPKGIFLQEDMFKFILDELAKKNSYYNPSGVSKLNQIIQIVHEWYLRLSSDSSDFASFIAKTRKLVIGTLVGIGKSSYEIAKHKYDIAIIDEAARASASELAMAMQSAKKIILVGDHKQLPPLYSDKLILNVSKKLNISQAVVRQTDFERAYKNLEGSMLDIQYRMQPAIGNMISSIFYENKLKTGIDTKNELSFLSNAWLSTVTWIDTTSCNAYETKNKNSSSIANKLEADIICNELKNITQNYEALTILYKWFENDKSQPIGIITGYKDQVHEIKKRLDEEWASSISDLVKVDTIDSYQGGENRVIILSLVRANESKITGFMNDEARMNVALSRAKNNLIIIGDSTMWKGKNSPLTRVYQYIEKNQTAKEHYNIVAYKK